MSDVREFNTYPSGFVGIKHPKTIYSNPKNQLDIARSVFDRVETRARDFMIHSDDVMDLFHTLNSRNHDKYQLEFLERVIVLASRHFDPSMDLMDWIELQLGAQTTDLAHEKWITETVGVVIRGWRRKVQTHAWCVMTSAADGVKRRETPMSAELCSTLGHELAGGSYVLNMGQFTLMWLRREGGMVDMVQSLRVLYGLR